MSLSRYLPNTRETAEETKRRVWREHGIVVVDPDKDQLPWEDKEIVKMIGKKLYGPRRKSDAL